MHRQLAALSPPPTSPTDEPAAKKLRVEVPLSAHPLDAFTAQLNKLYAEGRLTRPVWCEAHPYCSVASPVH